MAVAAPSLAGPGRTPQPNDSAATPPRSRELRRANQVAAFHGKTRTWEAGGEKSRFEPLGGTRQVTDAPGSQPPVTPVPLPDPTAIPGASRRPLVRPGLRPSKRHCLGSSQALDVLLPFSPRTNRRRRPEAAKQTPRSCSRRQTELVSCSALSSRHFWDGSRRPDSRRPVERPSLYMATPSCGLDARIRWSAEARRPA